MEYDQFWEWMEFNRLSTFTSAREDWRSAQLLSKLHNVNTTKESHLTSPNDFMPRSIDKIIEDEIAEEERENQVEPAEASIHSFNSFVKRLKASGKPSQHAVIRIDI